jgi:hypothetical protein
MYEDANAAMLDVACAGNPTGSIFRWSNLGAFARDHLVQQPIPSAGGRAHLSYRLPDSFGRDGVPGRAVRGCGGRHRAGIGCGGASVILSY